MAREANPIPERGMKIDQKFRNLLMAICSRTKGYCFQEQQAIVFLLFSNLTIPKQGIKMQIFFPIFKRVVETAFKNGHLPVKLHSSPLPREFQRQHFANNIQNRSLTIVFEKFKNVTQNVKMTS